MQKSYSPKPHNMVDYYKLPNGYADVFMRKNEQTETDEEGNTLYVADEVYFQIKGVSKEQIEDNFEYMWQDAQIKSNAPTAEERLEALETAVLDMILGGIM